jgi:AbrB family looped-hinge helix DNA binding protein
METTRLSTKGQIVLPRSIRASRAWEPGTEFTVEETREGILLKPKSAFKVGATTVDEVAGYLGRIREAAGGKMKRVSLKQMDAAITSEVTRRRDLGRY